MLDKPLDWNAKLVRFFINNSRLVWVLLLVFLVGGLFSLLNLRREGFPQVSAKIVLVQTVYPGAAPNEVERLVTKELESALKDIKNVKEISSLSQNSFSNITIQFDEGASLDQITQEVQSKVQGARANLPPDAEQSRISSFATGGPAFVFGVTNGTDEVELRKDAESLVNTISTVKGLKSTKLVIDREKRITIKYRPADLQQKGVNLSILSQIIQAANVTLPIGSIPVQDKQQGLLSIGSFTSLQDIENVTVGFNPASNQPVLLKDVAEITTGLNNTEQIERIGIVKEGKLVSSPGILVSTEITKDADILTVKKAIDTRIEDRKNSGDLDKSIQVTYLVDQAKSTGDQISEIVDAAVGSRKNLWLLGGIQLLFLAMLLFVNLRAALIATLSIPLSFGFTFILLNLLGIQLNTIVLFSLILVLGLIVDPAIVMVEAIQRYKDLGYTSRNSVLESGRRYGASLFIAVLTSLIVFFPFGVVSGIFGQIIKYIPITVVPALLASYFVPMALLPLLMERLIKKNTKDGEIVDEDEELSRPARGVMRINTWFLAKLWRQLILLLAMAGLIIASLSLVPTGKVNVVQFSKPKDTPEINVTAAFVKGLNFEERNKISRQIEMALSKEATVKHFYYFQQDASSLILSVQLKDKKDRPNASDLSREVVKRLKENITPITKLEDVTVSEQGVGAPESAYPIQTQISSNDPIVLEKAAKDLGKYISTMEHVTKVDDGYTNRNLPQVQIVLNREKLQAAGLSSFEVGFQLKSLVDESKLSKFTNSVTGETEDIYLVSAQKATSNADIANLSLATRNGTTIKVSDIATITSTTTIDTIARNNGSRYATVKAKVDNSKNTISVQQKLNDYLTPEKIKALGLDSRDSRGEFDDIAKSFKELAVALVIAILLTYIVLVLQFKSFSLPVIMLLTVPLSLIGVFPALWLTGSDLGFLELLGVTILVGIVENVAIFLIDYANQLRREQGLSAKEAIIQATGVRFRPILLTKLVALAGMLPLAIESDFWRGLAVVIIAGIGLSGFFSLVVIPILYIWLDALRNKVHKGQVTY